MNNDTYIYLVERRTDEKKFILIGNLKNCNVGSGKFLYDFVSSDYEYARETPYGLRSNISTGIKYKAKQYRIVHCTKVA